MKSEERHKLHQNVLALWLAQTFTKIKPYQNVILAAVIVVILAVIFWAWWTSESASQSNRAWTQFFTAFDELNPPAALEKVAEDNPRSRAAAAADLVAADLQLAQGCNMLFINKATANQGLDKALGLYQSVYAQSPSSALRAQAAFGLARTCESLGKLETATKFYTEVTAQWPDTVFARMSSRRLEDLKRGSVKEMYDKFAQFDPKPAFSQPPGVQSGLDKLPEEGPVFTSGAPDQLGVEEKKEKKKSEKADNKTETNKPEEKTEKPADH
jgi:predicted negative regulator of RcsB-dependent stress response